MTVTLEQAIFAKEFHYGNCVQHIGPRGGVTVKREMWRRNGKTKLWTTRPMEFLIPIKRGMRIYSHIEHDNAANWHAAEDCPLNKQ